MAVLPGSASGTSPRGGRRIIDELLAGRWPQPTGGRARRRRLPAAVHWWALAGRTSPESWKDRRRGASGRRGADGRTQAQAEPVEYLVLGTVRRRRARRAGGAVQRGGRVRTGRRRAEPLGEDRWRGGFWANLSAELADT